MAPLGLFVPLRSADVRVSPRRPPSTRAKAVSPAQRRVRGATGPRVPGAARSPGSTLGAPGLSGEAAPAPRGPPPAGLGRSCAPGAPSCFPPAAAAFGAVAGPWATTAVFPRWLRDFKASHPGRGPGAAPAGASTPSFLRPRSRQTRVGFGREKVLRGRRCWLWPGGHHPVPQFPPSKLGMLIGWLGE